MTREIQVKDGLGHKGFLARIKDAGAMRGGFVCRRYDTGELTFVAKATYRTHWTFVEAP